MAVLLSHGSHSDPTLTIEVNQCQSTNNRQCEQCIDCISQKNDVGTLNDHLTTEFTHLTGSADIQGRHTITWHQYQSRGTRPKQKTCERKRKRENNIKIVVERFFFDQVLN